MVLDSLPDWVSQPPDVGDIITCYYPSDPKRALRPALVLELRVSDDLEEFSVRVAYGTSKTDRPEREHVSLTITDNGQVAMCGLAVPTRFDLETQATITWSQKECGCWRGFTSPVIGHLTKGLQVDCAHKLNEMQKKK